VPEEPPATGRRVKAFPAVHDAWGVADGYHDARGLWHDTTPEARAALHRAFDADGADPPPHPGMWFVDPGDAASLWNPCDLVLEDNTVLSGISALPPDLPLGYHWLHPLDGWAPVQLVVTPRRCPDRRQRRWGWATQLYALRSARSWGIGDLGDLTELARWTAGRGGTAILTNPLHAPPPHDTAAPSPYYASSRLMVSPLMVSLPDVEGYSELAAALEPLQRAAQQLNATPAVDRHAVWRWKRPALERLFAWQQQRPTLRAALDAWTARQTTPVVRWATFATLSERLGRSWPTWPDEYRQPYGSPVAEFALAHASDVRFHTWVQWNLDRQRATAAARGVELIGDLAVGFAPDGFDAWLWQDQLALDTRVGAPPDLLAPAGQDWGLPPFVPWKLRRERYAPFIETVRANMAAGGGLRIDHVMGLFRLFCIPASMDASSGTYVHYQYADLLDVLALEAHRAGTFVIGEDLGTVDETMRAELSERHISGCRVWWFESTPPSQWPVRSVASATTHDLPTIAGVWSGADADARRRIGVLDEAAAAENLARVRRASPTATSAADAVGDVYGQLARAGSDLVLIALDDAAGSEEAPNIPGTIDEWPNWRLSLPMTFEQLRDTPAVGRLIETVTVGRRARREGATP
jgi:4-alpha-glucanotransferase